MSRVGRQPLSREAVKFVGTSKVMMMHIMLTLMDKMDILDMVGNVSKVMNIEQDGHDGHTEFTIMFIFHEHDGGDGYVPGNEPNQWR